MSQTPETNTETCRMCFKPAALEQGHVVPAFVFRWLKQTAVLPYLRTGENPNVRVQDGWKRPMFCRACEDKIGRYEKAFAEELFPLIVTEQPVPYRHGPWLSRFIASVALRTVMLYAERRESFDFFTDEQKALLPKAIEHWRAFVHGEAGSGLGFHELHFIPMGVFADYRGDRTLPPNLNRYTLRTIEVHVASNTSQAFAFVKMGPAVALAFIQPPPQGAWAGTCVSLGDGQVGGRMVIPLAFLDYFIERALRLHASQRFRSARQQEKIKQAFAANLKRAARSETVRATAADVKWFGVDRAFASQDEPDAGGAERGELAND